MLNPKLWLKNRLERLLLLRPFVVTEMVQRCGLPLQDLQIVMPHRLNWPLTNAALLAFQRLTTGNFGITLVVNFDEIPANWAGKGDPRFTLVRNRCSVLGKLLRKLLKTENGSLNNAFAIETALKQEPGFRWAIVTHNDSAPLCRGWNQFFFAALGNGLVLGNLRDTTRVFAAHSSGTLFSAEEFRQRNGSAWPEFRFGELVRDVADGITLTLHPPGRGLVPVLPNTRQSPELAERLNSYPLLRDFAENGTHVSFSADGKTPVFAHMGRGTPRSKADPGMAHKLPVEAWITMLTELPG